MLPALQLIICMWVAPVVEWIRPLIFSTALLIARHLTAVGMPKNGYLLCSIIFATYMWTCRQGYIRGLSGKFVDTACFHCFLCTFQTSLTYYNSVTQKWIKYKADTVLCHIDTRLLLLWQRRVEITRARQTVLNLKYQILFIYFNNIISEPEMS